MDFEINTKNTITSKCFLVNIWKCRSIFPWPVLPSRKVIYPTAMDIETCKLGQYQPSNSYFNIEKELWHNLGFYMPFFFILQKQTRGKFLTGEVPMDNETGFNVVNDIVISYISEVVPTWIQYEYAWQRNKLGLIHGFKTPTLGSRVGVCMCLQVVNQRECCIYSL